MFNALRGRLASSSAVNVGRRTLMTKSEFDAHVPEHVKAALTSSMPKAQQVGVGECLYRSAENRAALQKELHPEHAELPTSKFGSWSQENTEGVMSGHPALVSGYGVAAKTSEWDGGWHAAVVVSGTKESQGQPATSKSKLLMVDPDTTHHPETRQAAQDGALEPRHLLREVTPEELEKISPQQFETAYGYERLPIVSQTTGKEKPQEPSPGIFDRIKNWVSGS